MADTHETPSPISRRMWLAGLGGGAMSVPVLWWFDRAGRRRQAGGTTSADALSMTFVEHDGWMLTAEDVAALAARSAAR